jgi:cysteine desulfuration protein SufE
MSTLSAPLPASLDRVLQRLQRVTAPKQKYEQLIWFAKRLGDFPEAQKTSDNKVPGCASQVYVIAHLENGRVMYQGDSDAQLVKGLVALLVEGLNGLTVAEIVKLTPDFIQATGLDVSLTPSRANGFYNIFSMMQQKAAVLGTDQS